MFTSITSIARTSAARASLARNRTLHSTPVTLKTVTEKVSEVADKVNKKVGKGLASAIETGEKATQTTKETIGSAVKETKGKAEHASDVASRKVNQTATGAHEAKEDFKKEVRK